MGISFVVSQEQFIFLAEATTQHLGQRQYFLHMQIFLFTDMRCSVEDNGFVCLRNMHFVHTSKDWYQKVSSDMYALIPQSKQNGKMHGKANGT